MKLFKHIIVFFVFSVLFNVTASAETLSLTGISIDNSVEKDHSTQSFSSLGINFYMDAEIEPLISISQPDNLPSSLDDEISKKDGLLNRSLKLSLAFGSSFQNYDRNFFNISFKKEILFPFHSFW